MKEKGGRLVQVQLKAFNVRNLDLIFVCHPGRSRSIHVEIFLLVVTLSGTAIRTPLAVICVYILVDRGSRTSAIYCRPVRFHGTQLDSLDPLLAPGKPH